MTSAYRFRQACLAVIAMTIPLAVAAQDSLRVLRIEPSADGMLQTPLVITFDHPVAPQLALSLNPDSAVTLVPRAGAWAYWRNPSTLAVILDETRPWGTSYSVQLSPALHSASGLPLARADTVRRMVSAKGLQVWRIASTRADGRLDPIPHMRLLVESFVSEDWAALRVRLRSEMFSCGIPSARPPVMSIASVRAAAPSEALSLAGWADRDSHATGSLYVVEMAAREPVSRSCLFTTEVSRADAPGVITRGVFAVRPAFLIQRPYCSGSTTCGDGPFALDFNQPVRASEIGAHVRVDGTGPQITGDSVATRWWLPEKLQLGVHTLTVSGAMRSVEGDSLGANVTFTRHVLPAPPWVAHHTEIAVLPREARTLLPVRYGRSDTLVVVVSRVGAGALGPRDTGSWRDVAGDSVVLRYPVRYGVTRDQVLRVPVADLPRAWRYDTPVAVRAFGISRAIARAGAAGVNVAREPPVGLGFVVLRRTDVAIHAYKAEGEVRAWTTALTTGRPLAKVLLRLSVDGGASLATAVTSADGTAILRYSASADSSSFAPSTVLEARRGKDVSRVGLQSGLIYPRRAPPSERDVDERGEGRMSTGLVTLHGAAFADRAWYHTGDQVHLKGIVRRYSSRDGYSVSRGDTVRWVMRGPGDDTATVLTQHGTLDAAGSTVTSIVVPTSAPQGTYAVVLSIARGSDWHRVASATLSISDERTPRVPTPNATLSAAGDVKTSTNPILRTERPQQLAGAHTSVHVNSGARGAAWIVLRDHTILWDSIVHLNVGDNVLDVPLPAHARPGTWIDAIVPRLSSDPRYVQQVRAYLPLLVQRSGDGLNVTIDRGPRGADGEEFTVTVRDAAGRPSRCELAVWATDEDAERSQLARSRLDLNTQLMVPYPPLYDFYSTTVDVLPATPPQIMWREWPTVREDRVNAKWIDAPSPLLRSQHEPAASSARFSDSSSYVGSIRTNSRGQARVTLRLPASGGSWVTAVAVDDGVSTGYASLALPPSRQPR